MQDTQVKIAVNAGDHASFPGSVHQLTTEGVVAMFQGTTCPDLGVGRVVELVFSSPTSDVILPVEARLMSASEMPPLRCYSFSFCEAVPQVSDLVSCPARQERRRSTRIRIAAGESNLALVLPGELVSLVPKVAGVAVLENGSVSVTGTVHDISIQGVCARMDPQLEGLFVASDRVDVELHLAEETLLVTGRIRHRQHREGMYDYGIRFDWASTRNSKQIQNALILALSGFRKQAKPV